jgi:hypothetical protein
MQKFISNVQDTWKSGPIGKIAIGCGLPMAMCFACFFCTAVLPTPTRTVTPIANDVATRAPAETATLVVLDVSATPQPTAFSEPSATEIIPTQQLSTATLVFTSSPTTTSTRTPTKTRVFVTAVPATRVPLPTQALPTIGARVRTGAKCDDGTTSSATGSGACSGHQGVNCWFYSDGTCTKP